MFWMDNASGCQGCTPLTGQKISRESVSLRDCFDLLDTFCLSSSYTKAIGNLSNNDGDGYKNVTTKVSSRFLFIKLIPSRLIRQILANDF